MTNRLRGLGTALTCCLCLTGTPAAQAGDVSVLQLNGRGYFIQNNRIIDLRGVNYDLLVPNSNPDNPGYYHNMFDPCTDGRTSYPVCYGDGSQAEAMIRYIHGSGYNYIRVFVGSEYTDQGFTYSQSHNSDGTRAGQAAPNTLPDIYWHNMSDFLQRASNNGMRVILTGEGLPSNFPYQRLACGTAPPPAPVVADCTSGENDVLFNPNWAAAYSLFWFKLLTSIRDQNTWPNAFSAIMAIDVKQELSVRSDQMPLSDQSLTTLQIDNGTYNMSDFSYQPHSRQVLIDDLTKNFALTLGSAIHQADNTRSILVSISVVPPAARGQPNAYGGANGSVACPASASSPCTFPVRQEILSLYGGVDYNDIHVYAQYNDPGYLDRALQSAAFVYGGTTPKPTLMGEFGALRAGGQYDNPWPDAASAANGLQAHVVQSCNYGISGWGLWTWSTQNYYSPQQWWSAIILNSDGSQNSPAINGAIAPAAWSPPC